MKKYIRPQLICCDIDATDLVAVSVSVFNDGQEITDSKDILVKENQWDANEKDVWDDVW